MINKLLLLLLVTFSVEAADWSLTDPLKGWNDRGLVTLYHHNSELQTQWAWEALSNYTFKGDERVLDFGSGDGKLTAMISFMVPRGKVTGIDLSKHMITYASKMFPQSYYKNLEFRQSPDVGFKEAALDGPFDLITSFCVFHLVPDPEVILTHLKQLMHPKSKLVLTSPLGGNKEFFQAASEELAKRGWSFPTATDGTLIMRNPEKAKELFQRLGFKLEHFKAIGTRTPYNSKEEFIDWLEGTVTANWNIPEEGRRAFFTDVTNRFLELKPEEQDADGFTYYYLDRIDIVASLDGP